tara:strand:- start:118 stop:1026 length:909 start_codon:yes stop_codon:yes gene_type:complete
MMNDEQRMSVSDYFGGAKTSPAPQSQISEGGGAREGRSHPSAGSNGGNGGGNGGGASEGSNRGLSEKQQRDEDDLRDRFNREQRAVDQANNHPTHAIPNPQRYEMPDINLGTPVKSVTGYFEDATHGGTPPLTGYFENAPQGRAPSPLAGYFENAPQSRIPTPQGQGLTQELGFEEALSNFFTPNAESIAANRAASARYSREAERQRVADGGYVEQFQYTNPKHYQLMTEYGKQDRYPTFAGQFGADVDEAVAAYKETGGPMASFGKGLGNLFNGRPQGPVIKNYTGTGTDGYGDLPARSGK